MWEALHRQLEPSKLPVLTKRATELLFDWRQLSHFELMSSHHLIGRRVKASHLIQIKSANDSGLRIS